MQLIKSYLILFNFLSTFYIFPSTAHSTYLDVIEIDGPINPVVAEYVVKSIDEAEKEGAECLIVQMDTPGGLDLSMRAIIKRIFSSKVPVVVYVAPSGARAASAGAMVETQIQQVTIP